MQASAAVKREKLRKLYLTILERTAWLVLEHYAEPCYYFYTSRISDILLWISQPPELQTSSGLPMSIKLYSSICK